MPRTTLLLLMLIAMPLSGCRAMGYLGYVFFPGTGNRKVKAECTKMNDHSVAVIVYADTNTQYVHPNAQGDLTTLISSEFQNKLNNVTPLDSDTIMIFQRSNLNWVEMDKTEIASKLNVDYVLFVSLVEFATTQAEFNDLLQARITGEVTLYKAGVKERQASVWQGRPIQVKFPKTETVRQGNNEYQFRLIAMRMFADKVAKKFYNHEEKPK